MASNDSIQSKVSYHLTPLILFKNTHFNLRGESRRINSTSVFKFMFSLNSEAGVMNVGPENLVSCHPGRNNFSSVSVCSSCDQTALSFMSRATFSISLYLFFILAPKWKSNAFQSWQYCDPLSLGKEGEQKQIRMLEEAHRGKWQGFQFQFNCSNSAQSRNQDQFFSDSI